MNLIQDIIDWENGEMNPKRFSKMNPKRSSKMNPKRSSTPACSGTSRGCTNAAHATSASSNPTAMSLQFPPLPKIEASLFREREGYFRMKRHLDCAIEHARLAGMMVGSVDACNNHIQPNLAQIKRALSRLEECREALQD